MSLKRHSIESATGSAIAGAADRIENAGRSPAPHVASFREFLEHHAKVRTSDGRYIPYSFKGREPLIFVAELISKIIRNTLHGETVEIDGESYKPGALKNSTVSVCGGAQFGKTVLELNFGGYVTAIEFVNFGYYTPDQGLLETIVDTKFRPDILDQVPWISQMITLGKAENSSGKAVNRKNSFQVTDGTRKAFGHFCGMQKPPTTISLDVAVLDERDDIPGKNVGFVDARMTNSPVHLTISIGTQRIHAAGQNAAFEAGTQHVWTITCQGCGHRCCPPDEFPGIYRLALDGHPQPTDPKITEEMQHDADSVYYMACPECGRPLDPATGHFVPQKPGLARQRNWSIRISQFDCAAMSANEALQDPSGEKLVAFWCDRAAKPRAGAAQPIDPSVLERARLSPEPYNMSLTRGSHPRVMGMDTGPRCWLWCDEILSPEGSPMVWAEMVASGRAAARVKLLYELLGLSCVFMDAGGEPELTASLVLALNGLDSYSPPVMPAAELKKQQLTNIGSGLSWDGSKGRWTGIRAAAVAFSVRQASGIIQDVGITVDGKIYPLIKVNRAEAIQMAVNDFLTPSNGVVELVKSADGKMAVRQAPRARLPTTYIGAGATQSVVDTHLQNLRKTRDPRTGEEDWADQVENHLGLAKVYARLAAMVATAAPRVEFQYRRIRQEPGYRTNPRSVLI